MEGDSHPLQHRWRRDRFLLLGDFVHAIEPHSSQGLLCHEQGAEAIGSTVERIWKTNSTCEKTNGQRLINDGGLDTCAVCADPNTASQTSVSRSSAKGLVSRDNDQQETIANGCGRCQDNGYPSEETKSKSAQPVSWPLIPLPIPTTLHIALRSLSSHRA